MKPFIKYPGGKRWLADLLAPHIKYLLEPKFQHFPMYYEPFLGSGAMALAIEPEYALLSDSNVHLMNIYQCISDQQSRIWAISAAQHEMIVYLRGDTAKRATCYYEARDRYNSIALTGTPDAEAAGTLLFLLKTCFNGLIRFNSRGKFNTPHGDYKNPSIDEKAITDANVAISVARIRQGDFEQVMESNDIPPGWGDVAYFDPPYQGTFTGYTGQRFGPQDQERLCRYVYALFSRGVRIFVSLPDIPEMRDMWGRGGLHAYSIPVTRSISAKSSGRGSVNELLVFSGSTRLPGFDAYQRVF